MKTASDRAGAPPRHRLVLALAVVIPLGLASKFYDGPGQNWVQPYAGGVLYEMFWIFAAHLVRPDLRVRTVATAVFLLTSALEVLQLWHPAWLEAVRGSFLGRALIGTTFAWWDFPHYLIGCLLGAWIVNRLAGSAERQGPADPRGG